jgi:hypothetical protein
LKRCRIAYVKQAKVASEFRNLIENIRDDFYRSEKSHDISLQRINEIQSDIVRLESLLPGVWRSDDLRRLQDYIERTKNNEKYVRAMEWLRAGATGSLIIAADAAFLLFMTALEGQQITWLVMVALCGAVGSAIGVLSFLLRTFFKHQKIKNEERSTRNSYQAALEDLAATVGDRLRSR